MRIDRLEHLSIELTYACPNRCWFCYNSIAPSSTKAIDPEILHTLPESSTIALTGGEPLLTPPDDLRAVMDIASEKADNIVVQTASHQPRGLDILSNYGKATVQLSVLGVGKGHDMEVCRSGAFREIVETVKLMRSAGQPFTTSTVVSRSNIDELGSILEWSVGAGSRHILLIRFNPRTPLDRKKILSAGEYESMLETAEETALRYGVPVSLGMPDPGVVDALGLRHILHTSCTAGRDSFAIGADGLVRICPHSRVVVGNLEEDIGTWRRRSKKLLAPSPAEIDYVGSKEKALAWRCHAAAETSGNGTDPFMRMLYSQSPPRR